MGSASGELVHAVSGDRSWPLPRTLGPLLAHPPNPTRALAHFRNQFAASRNRCRVMAARSLRLARRNAHPMRRNATVHQVLHPFQGRAPLAWRAPGESRRGSRAPRSIAVPLERRSRGNPAPPECSPAPTRPIAWKRRSATDSLGFLWRMSGSIFWSRYGREGGALNDLHGCGPVVKAGYLPPLKWIFPPL